MALNRWPNASMQIQQTAQLVSKHKEVHDFLLDQQFKKYIRGNKIQDAVIFMKKLKMI